MKHKVIREFKDKYTKIRYYPGDVYEHDDPDRITFLQENGYLGEEVEPPPKPQRKVKNNGSAGRRKAGAKDK